MQIQPPTTIEESIRLLLHYVGITKLTKKNIKKVYLRSKQVQVILQQGGFWQERMPYLEELEEHIGFEAEAPVTHDDKKWEQVMVMEITHIAKQWQIQEEERLEKEGKQEEIEEEIVSKTINEQNEEATQDLEKLTKDLEEAEEYPKYQH